MKKISGKGALTGIQCRQNNKTTKNHMDRTEINVSYKMSRNAESARFAEYNRWAIGGSGYLEKAKMTAKSKGLKLVGSDSFAVKGDPYKTFCAVFSKG